MEERDRRQREVREECDGRKGESEERRKEKRRGTEGEVR